MAGKEQCCNACGRRVNIGNDLPGEDVLSVKKSWGYFSGKDLEIHEFILCEQCYDKMTAGFVIPVTVSDKSEVLVEE